MYQITLPDVTFEIDANCLFDKIRINKLRPDKLVILLIETKLRSYAIGQCRDGMTLRYISALKSKYITSILLKDRFNNLYHIFFDPTTENPLNGRRVVQDCCIVKYNNFEIKQY